MLQLEQECLEVYRRKLDHASHAHAQLHKDLANAEAEYSALLFALGEAPISLCLCLLHNLTKVASKLEIIG
ncbi:unnamed protein product [Sphagnum tenellum]